MSTEWHESVELHEARARASCRALGLSDCIHRAPDAVRRADALYAVANATEAYLRKGSVVGLLADGRMVVTVPRPEGDVWFAETVTGG